MFARILEAAAEGIVKSYVGVNCSEKNKKTGFVK